MSANPIHTVLADSNGSDWAWYVHDGPGTTGLSGVSRRITDIEDDARHLIWWLLSEGTGKSVQPFDVDVQLARPVQDDEDVPQSVLCDIDGTLAERGHRGPYDFDRVETDYLNAVVSTTLAMWRDTGRTIILLSGRQSEYRPHTERWLSKHAVKYDMLLMRPEGDRRSDDVVKLELFDQYVRGITHPILVLDDRDRCVYLWRKLGLTTWQVADGAF